MNWIIYNGRLIKREEARIPLLGRPIAYGDGCFGTMRNYGGFLLELQKHVERLHAGMKYLKLQIPEKLQKSALKSQIQQLLEKNQMADQQSVVRVQVWRKGELGYAPKSDSGTEWAISAGSLPQIGQSIKLVQVATRRIPSDSLNSSYKLSNGINYIRAALEAEEGGGDDALMLTINDYISETTVANIFWMQNDTVYTPNLECDILPGITRAVLSHIIRNRTGQKLVKGKFEISDLYEAEAVWVCNSLREVLPVYAIDDYKYDTDHETFKQVQKQFEAYKEQYLEPLKE